jgi:hypothetical protein
MSIECDRSVYQQEHVGLPATTKSSPPKNPGNLLENAETSRSCNFSQNAPRGKQSCKYLPRALFIWPVVSFFVAGEVDPRPGRLVLFNQRRSKLPFAGLADPMPDGDFLLFIWEPATNPAIR